MSKDHAPSARVLAAGRGALGLTQRGMADWIGMEASDYCAVERGRRRFPIARLGRLPRGLALKVAEAMVDEFRAELKAIMEEGR